PESGIEKNRFEGRIEMRFTLLILKTRRKIWQIGKNAVPLHPLFVSAIRKPALWRPEIAHTERITNSITLLNQSK
ncbi:MAG: hypothetical protein IKT22_00290, partial [Prevotella sp.]|nr:hypothetical protein [Prevotella sp.]